jgi:hypothetical protein
VDSPPHAPRPRRGRRLLPRWTGRAIQRRTTRDQHQRNDHAAWSPPSGSAPWSSITPAACPGRTCGGRVCAPASSRAPQPTRRHPGAGPAPFGRPGGERGAAVCVHAKRRPRSAVDTRASHPLPTFDHPLPSQARFGQRRPRRSPTTATRRTRCTKHGRSRGTDVRDPSAVRTARTQRPRTPDACPSGHPHHTRPLDTGRLDTGRPPDQWTDVRTADRGRGQRDEQRGRRPDVLDGHDGGDRRLGGPNLARVTASAVLGNR